MKDKEFELQHDLGQARERIAIYTKTIGEQSAEITEIKKDAERYRWLRAQHEGVETTEDAEGFSHTEPAARTFTVFMPGKEMHLEPVSCWPGELDAAIDMALTQNLNSACCQRRLLRG